MTVLNSARCAVAREPLYRHAKLLVMGRVLGRVRLSRSTDESTSEGRQREAVETWAKMHGHVIVGWAIDLDVSGGLDPFSTPELGHWLNHKLDDFDIICAYRLDRVARRVIPLNGLFGWCNNHGKTIASVSENIDLSHWVGRLVANVIAGVAEGELEAIQERNIGSKKTLRKLGRWHGGTMPIGYQKVRKSDGYYLEVNEERAEIVREVCNRVGRYEPLREIADDLNNRGVPSPGKSSWTALAITRMIRSFWIVGQMGHKPESVRQHEEQNKVPHNQRKPLQVVTEEDGITPIQFADPLISFQQWRELNGIIDNRSRPKNRRNGTGLLTGVVTCSLCEEPLYHNVTRKRGVSYRSWICGGRYKRKNGCESRSVSADWLEAVVEDQLLSRIGEVERQERVYVQGVSHGDSIAQVDDAIKRLKAESDADLLDSPEEYITRLTKLKERRDALKALPEQSSGFEWRGLGETYGEAWQRMSREERRSLMLDSGITVQAKYAYAYLDVPEDLLERAFPGYTYEEPEPFDFSQYQEV